jgi:hypothetical protein
MFLSSITSTLECVLNMCFEIHQKMFFLLSEFLIKYINYTLMCLYFDGERNPKFLVALKDFSSELNLETCRHMFYLFV